MSHTAAPKAPVLEWGSFVPFGSGSGMKSLPSVDQLSDTAYTSSGRAALLAVLRLLKLPAGARVGVPTYHCPTMVAPVLAAGCSPWFYGIGRDGLPLLHTLGDADGRPPAAVIAAQLFGLPQSMADLRRWCDEHGTVLIEDCAHSLFGCAGDRPVGTWGHYATASLTKFYPLSEAGLVASGSRALPPLGLKAAPWVQQMKGVLDPLEQAVEHRRLAGVRHGLRPLMALKRRMRAQSRAAREEAGKQALEQTAGASAPHCDLSRVDQAPSRAAVALHRCISTRSVVAPRQRNFAAIREVLGDDRAVPQGRNVVVDRLAPYAFPLHLVSPELADRVYLHLRTEGHAVFRWDQQWPGTPAHPALKGDEGARWSRVVLQLLCHQSLGEDTVRHTAQRVRDLIEGTARTSAALTPTAEALA